MIIPADGSFYVVGVAICDLHNSDRQGLSGLDLLSLDGEPERYALEKQSNKERLKSNSCACHIKTGVTCYSRPSFLRVSMATYCASSFLLGLAPFS